MIASNTSGPSLDQTNLNHALELPGQNKIQPVFVFDASLGVCSILYFERIFIRITPVKNANNTENSHELPNYRRFDKKYVPSLMHSLR